MIKRLLLLIMAVQARKRNKTRIGRQQEKESVFKIEARTKKVNLQLTTKKKTHKVTHFTGYNKSIGLTARRRAIYFQVHLG